MAGKMPHPTRFSGKNASAAGKMRLVAGEMRLLAGEMRSSVKTLNRLVFSCLPFMSL
jgi:hypothetical protein